MLIFIIYIGITANVCFRLKGLCNILNLLIRLQYKAKQGHIHDNH